MNGPLEECNRKAQEVLLAAVNAAIWQCGEALVWVPVFDIVDGPLTGAILGCIWEGTR
jgi:hypothetical protein